MGSGHIIPGSRPTAPDGDAIPAQPASPAPTHVERARKLLASQTRGALSTIAVQPAWTPSIAPFSDIRTHQALTMAFTEPI